MNPRNRMQQLVAVLGAAGVSAVMGLPALAQQGVVNNGATNNGLLNPNPSIFNETPYNRAQVSPQQVPNNCAGYVRGGIGGPVDNTSDNTSDNASPSGNNAAPQRSSSYNNTNRSSDAVASQGIPGNYQGIPGQDTGSMSNSMSSSTSGNYNNQTASRNQINRQFDAQNPAAGVAFRANGPAGTSGRESIENLRAYNEGRMGNMQAMAPASNNPLTSANRVDLNRQQFDAQNPAAGLAFRANGPAGTSGKEASMNLQEFSRSDRNNNQVSNPAVSAGRNSEGTAPQANISAAPLPAECTP